MSNVQVGQSVSNEGRIFVEEEGDDGAEGGCEEEEAGDGEENTGGFADEAVDTGDAGAGVGEDEAEECEADPAGDVEAAAGGGDGEDDHDGEAGKGERDNEFEIEAVRIGDEKSEQDEGGWCCDGDEREHDSLTSREWNDRSASVIRRVDFSLRNSTRRRDADADTGAIQRVYSMRAAVRTGEYWFGSEM
jgi:hypothetical protein